MKTYKDYVLTNDFEGAKSRYEYSNGRWKNYWWRCVEEIFNTFEEWSKKYILDPIKKTISKVHLVTNYLKEKATVNGLYLVGSTYFNPFTDEKFYWIKVGKACDIERRMKEYATHNPMLWKNNFIELNKTETSVYEKKCHKILEKICLKVANNTKEWFQVNREDYLEICNRGFEYFGLV